MNQVFTKKKLAAALTLAFATGGAAVLAVAPVPGLVAAAQANQFADTTMAAGTTAGVAVPKSTSAALSGQTIAITENVTGALSPGQIVLTPSAGKFVSASAAGTNSMTVGVPTVDSNGNLLVPINNISSGGPSTISVNNIVMDTNSLSFGTAITATVSTSSTVTGLTKGTSVTLATVTAPGVTVKATQTTTPTYGKLGATTIVNTIEVAESILSSVKDMSGATDEITVTLPTGYTFTGGGATGGTDNFTTDDGTITSNVIKYNVTGTGTGSAGKVILGATNWNVYIPSGAADGNVDAAVAVKLSDGTTKTSTVTLFKVASAGSNSATYNTGTTTAPTTFPTLYAGRTAQNPGVDVAVSENVGNSFLAGGNVSLTFPTGVNTGKGYSAVEVASTLGVNAVATVANLDGTAAAADKNGILATLASAADGDPLAGKVTFKLDSLNLTDAAATGDLNVTVGGNAGVTAGTTKIATVIRATTTTAAAGPTVTAGSILALPEISMVENKAAALAAGAINLYIAGANGVNLTATNAKAKAYKADGTDISLAILGNAAGVTPTVTTAGVASFNVATPSDTNTGPVTLKITGLSATMNTTAAAGDITAVVGGGFDAADTTPTSNEGAKAFKESVVVGKIVAATVPVINATVTGANTSQTITGNVVAAGNDQGKQGMIYLAAEVPNAGVFLKNSAGSWVTYNATAPVAVAGPVTLGTTSIEITKDLNVSSIIGSKIYLGYGIGTTAFGAVIPWNNMLSAGTYATVYTIQ